MLIRFLFESWMQRLTPRSVHMENMKLRPAVSVRTKDQKRGEAAGPAPSERNRINSKARSLTRWILFDSVQKDEVWKQHAGVWRGLCATPISLLLRVVLSPSSYQFRGALPPLSSHPLPVDHHGTRRRIKYVQLLNVKGKLFHDLWRMKSVLRKEKCFAHLFHEPIYSRDTKGLCTPSPLHVWKWIHPDVLCLYSLTRPSGSTVFGEIGEVFILSMFRYSS